MEKPYTLTKMMDEDLSVNGEIVRNLWAEIRVGKFGPFVVRVRRGPDQARELQAAIDQVVRDVQALSS